MAGARPEERPSAAARSRCGPGAVAAAPEAGQSEREERGASAGVAASTAEALWAFGGRPRRSNSQRRMLVQIEIQESPKIGSPPTNSNFPT